MAAVEIRRMRRPDVSATERISDEAFHAVDLARLRRSAPEPQRRSAERSARWIARTERILRSDPDGCWVAEDAGEVIGFATSIVRERFWGLVTFATTPGRQGEGIGRQLLAATLAYGAGCDHAMLAASDDPAAIRRYHRAGFTLHPQLTFTGEPCLADLGRAGDVRAGTDADLAWIDDLDRELRGGPHGPDHASMRATAPLLVDAGGRGYAYATGSELLLLGAYDAPTAQRLLTAVLARATGRFEIGHVTTANQWAVDVAMAARLEQDTQGYLGVRGLAPPAPYVHNAALL